MKYELETFCRQVFEYIYSKPFIKCRPNFLNGLELDGYCEELKIAFEYQGPHHYIDHCYQKGIIANSDIVKKRDLIKLEICSKNNITLFVINGVNHKSKTSIFTEIFKQSKILNHNHYNLSLKGFKKYLKEKDLGFNKSKYKLIRTKFSKCDKDYFYI